MQSIGSKTSPTECIPFVRRQTQKTKNPLKPAQNLSFLRSKDPFGGVHIYERLFGLLKNHHETRINTGENDHCKKNKKLA